jgi:hypothetical protein
MSALELLEHNNEIELTFLAKLGREREFSYLDFVTMANLKATQDKLLQLQGHPNIAGQSSFSTLLP